VSITAKRKRPLIHRATHSIIIADAWIANTATKMMTKSFSWDIIGSKILTVSFSFVFVLFFWGGQFRCTVCYSRPPAIAQCARWSFHDHFRAEKFEAMFRCKLIVASYTFPVRNHATELKYMRLPFCQWCLGTCHLQGSRRGGSVHGGFEKQFSSMYSCAMHRL